MATDSTPATTGNTTPKKFEESTLDNVINKISSFVSNGDIQLPSNYSPENAVRSAWLMLQDQKDRADKPVLEVCTKESIANCLLKMAVQGMNPIKAQCYFIPYGNKLTYQRSYAGAVALAKRVKPEIKEIKAKAIYEDDIFAFENDTTTGTTKVLKHEQSLATIDHEKVAGAYALIIYNDGTVDTEIMTIKQIRKAWDQGQMKGKSGAHINFTDEMAEKTVLNRACKPIINSSDDSDLMKDDEIDGDAHTANVKNTINQKANKTPLKFEDTEAVDVTDKKETPAAPEDKKSAIEPSKEFDQPKSELAF